MDVITYAKKSLEGAFKLVNMVADNIDDAQYNWQPDNTTCNSVAKSHVHAMTSTDFFINATLKGGKMEWAALAEQHGMPANPMEIWGFGGTIPVAPMKEFAASVQARALEYVAELKEDDLDRVVDTPFFGKQTVAFIIQLAGVHAAGHAGDMAAVKGMQGLKGLPF